MTKQFVVLLVALALCMTGAWAQTDAAPKTEDLPGYVAFDAKAVLGDVEPEVQVLLERPLLELMAASMGANESLPVKAFGPEIEKIIPQIDLLRVEIYEDIAPTAGKSIPVAVGAITTGLRSNGWSPIVRIPGDGDHVEFLMKTANGHIVGLAGFVAEADSLVVLNVAGKIDTHSMGTALGAVSGKVMSGKLKGADMSGLMSMLSGELPTQQSAESAATPTGQLEGI